MSLLRALRSLVLGETWIVPIGVALTVGAAAAIDRLGALSGALGAVVLVGGTLLTLALATVRPARGRWLRARRALSRRG